MTWVDVVGVVVAVGLAATVQLAAGFGFAMAAAPLLAIALDPHDAVVVSLCLATLTNAYQAWNGRTDLRRAVAGRLLLGAFLGLPIGFVVYLVADDRVLAALIGVTVLVAVVLIARGLDLRHAGPGLDVAGGAVAGTLTLSAGINGPPMVFVLQARHFPPASFRATITSVFFTLDVVGVTIFAITGDLDGGVLAAVAVALPALALGARAGIGLRRHLDPDRFRRLVLGLLVVAGVSALASAVWR